MSLSHNQKYLYCTIALFSFADPGYLTIFVMELFSYILISGVKAGSVAAAAQSKFYGGATTGVFSALQSAGVLGIGYDGYAGVGAAGAARVLVQLVWYYLNESVFFNLFSEVREKQKNNMIRIQKNE